MSTLSEEIKVRFLLDECTAEELRTVNAWLEESPENARQLFGLEELYQLGNPGLIPNEQKVLKEEKRLFSRLEGERHRLRKHVAMKRWTRFAAAAVFIIALAGAGYYLLHSAGRFDEPLLALTTGDEIKDITLADGTRVWLNKHSSLRYPQEFDGKQRRVYLEGEGYFEVKRDPGKPFIVRNNAMQVRVLGTVFNLKSDEKSRLAVATLLEGEIEVEGIHDEGRIMLTPGQRAELNGVSRHLVVKQGDTGFESWHSRQFIFDKADIFTIARTLEKSYDVKIILSPDINAQSTYTGALPRKENVGDVINQLGNVIPIGYKIVGSSVFLFSTKMN